MHVLLDLYGVLLEHEKTFRGYRERLAALLAARFGGDADAWRRAHDEAFVTYTRRANEADWDARGYGDVVDELDARHLQEMFERMGIPPATGDPLHLSRELEREALAGVNARFPDARTAIERLRRMGHRVYVATGGSEKNEAALRGYPRIAPRPQESPPPGGHAALRRGDLTKPRGPAAMGRDVDDVASLMTRARRTPGGASVRVPACGSPRSPRPGDRGSGGTDPRTRGQTRRSDC